MLQKYIYMWNRVFPLCQLIYYEVIFLCWPSWSQVRAKQKSNFLKSEGAHNTVASHAGHQRDPAACFPWFYGSDKSLS